MGQLKGDKQEVLSKILESRGITELRRALTAAGIEVEDHYWPATIPDDREFLDAVGIGTDTNLRAYRNGELGEVIYVEPFVEALYKHFRDELVLMSKMLGEPCLFRGSERKQE